MSSEPYDPYIPSGQSSQGTEDTRRIKEEIDATKKILQHNVELAQQRGDRAEDLRYKTQNLSDQAGQFRRGANKVRKQMWWKDMKMRIWLIIGIVVLLALIIIPAVVATRK
ncbi:hypothetical protein VTK56DRAFT_9505 [Thermocarpiscus australiensis]